MVYPLAHVLIKAFVVRGDFSLHFFGVMVTTPLYLEVLANSLNIALVVTALCTGIAYPLALCTARIRVPAAGLPHAAILMPLIVPPFVGVLGVQQLFGRFGSVNIALLDGGFIERPIDWLGAGNVIGIVALQTVHLVPLLYLSLRAALATAHPALEEAAIVSGASRWRVLRRITLPLSYPGWFAGAVLVFISSFTDLGTPLVFEYRNVVSMQIFNMLADLNENPVGYSFIVSVCVISVSLFFLSKASLTHGSFSGSGRTYSGEHQVSLASVWSARALSAGIAIYAALAAVPQLAVLVVAFSDDWFMTVFPTRWTFEHFVAALTHPLSARSFFTSLWLSFVASVCTVVLGALSAYRIARRRGRLGWFLETLTVLPLAVPGIVFAFGFIGAFAGSLIDNRINPFPLLIVAYIVRRTPAAVRSAFAGLQQASVALEEAAIMVGASGRVIAWRILLPLVRRHLAAAGVLTFAYSMIEVSDGILLALEERFYPVSKGLYALMARPDGVEVASALGSVVMVVLLVAFYGAEWLMRRVQLRRSLPALLPLISAAALLATPFESRAEARELVVASPHWEGIRYEFERGFAKFWAERSGEAVRIRWLDLGGTSDIIRYLRMQYAQSGQGVGIDLMFGGGLDSFIELARDRLLEPVTIDPAVLHRIPPQLAGVALYAPSGEWFAAALNAFGILYNRAALEKMKIPLPERWEDLAAPYYFDLIGAGDPRKSGSMHAMYEIILQGRGWDEGWALLRRIAANVRNFSGSASQVGKEIATAEVVCGLAIDTYAGSVIRQVGADRIGYSVPHEFPSFNGDGIAVLKGAPQREVARAFIEFVLSERGQRLLYARKGEPGGPQEYEISKLPLIPELYGTVATASVVQGSPFEWPHTVRYDIEVAAQRWNVVNDLFGVLLIDRRAGLVQRAGDAYRAGLRDPFALIRAVPISEREALQLSAGGAWGADPVQRSTSLKAWGEAAEADLPSVRSFWSILRWVPPGVFLLVLLGGAVGRSVRRWGSGRGW